MGSFSNRPKVPETANDSIIVYHTPPHKNLSECHEALEWLSKRGQLSLHRTRKTYTISCGEISFRGNSLCHALQGLVKRVKDKER